MIFWFFFFFAQENCIPEIPLRSIKMLKKNYLDTVTYHRQVFNKMFQLEVSSQVIVQRSLRH